MQQKKNQKEVILGGVLNNRVTKVALAASLLLTGTTSTISTVAPSNGILGGLMEVNHAEAASVFAGGTGTVADPYLISDARQLNEIRKHPTGHFMLTNDIELSDIEWSPIGTWNEPFKGTFEGNGFTINGLTITKQVNLAGLFGYVLDGTIKNIHLTNVDVAGGHSTGGLVGDIRSGTISNVSVEGKVKGGTSGTGGVIGTSGDNHVGPNLDNLKASVQVSGTDMVGGVVGLFNKGSLGSAYSTGNVSGRNSVGGVFGHLGAGPATIKNIYSTGDVSGTGQNVGGLIGQSYHVSNVSNGYATGKVSGDSYVGGLVGYQNSATLSNLYAFNEDVVSKNGYVGAAFGYVHPKAPLSTDIYMPETHKRVGGQLGVTHLLTNKEIFENSTYDSLVQNGVWEFIGDSKLPVLTFAPEQKESLKLKDKINYILKDGKIHSVINTAEELNQIKNSSKSASYMLMNDIDLSDLEWIPIGSTWNEPFQGTFEGNGFVINGLTISKSIDLAGLFGYVLDGTIKNIHLTDVDIDSDSNYAGGLVGEIRSGTINNVSVEGKVKGKNSIGGVVGSSGNNRIGPKLGNLKSTVEVVGNSNVGGVVGSFHVGTLESSFSTRNVSGADNVGGVVGRLEYAPSTVKNIYSTGDVSGGQSVGGLIGQTYYISNISNGYATGKVSGDFYIGGLVGFHNNGNLSNLYALNKEVVSKNGYVGAAFGYVHPKALKFTAISSISSLSNVGNVKDISRFISPLEAVTKDTYSNSGFEFGDIGEVPIWGIEEGSTVPYLKFNPSPMKYEPNGDSPDNLKIATDAVSKAEETKTQGDIDYARTLVNQLADGLNKNELTTRLNEVQKAIDDDKALAEQIVTATASVVKAEESKLQADVNTAKALVNVLPNGTEKTNLTTRLDTVQKAIDDDKALAEQIAVATASVTKAEGSKAQADIDSARTLVNQLVNGITKTELTNRLDALQQLVDRDKVLKEIKDALDNLGPNPTQEELDAIKDKIDELSDGPEKEILLDLIKEEQDDLDKTNAEKALAEQNAKAVKAVEQAEISKTQQDVTNAQSLVNKLPNGAIKTELNLRLEVVQQLIDLAKQLESVRSLVNKLGDNPTQGQIEQAHTAVESLPDSADKIELAKVVKAKQDDLNKKIVVAKEAVEAISTPPTLKEITDAQEKVNLLPAGDIKNTLQKQINNKQKELDEDSEQLAKAEAAVAKAESFPTTYNVTIATKLVEVLPNGPAKTALEDRLQVIQDVFALEKAEAKVKQAESFERDPYLADAIKMVDALKEMKGKQELKERLQVILEKLQAIKDAEEAAKNADGAYDPSDPSQSVEDAINTIQDKEAKKYFTNWNKAISNAENFFSKTTVKNATKYLTDLPSAYTSVTSYENIIKELTERTQNLKAEEVVEDLIAPVEKAVASYEKYKTSYYLKKAIEAVNTLADSPAKTAFELRLGLGDDTAPGNGQTEEEKLAAQLESVEKAVKNYEKFKTNFYLKKAVEAMSLLNDEEEKIPFQTRIDAVNK